MIAIVGMACQYPDADSPRALWENILSRRRAFRRFPKERLDLDDYFSPNRAMADAIYVTEGAFIEGYEFDRVKFRVAGPTYRSADLVHWLALDVAARALEDSGLDLGKDLPAESTGVIVGNTLTGEFSRASLMRLRWPYVRRVLDGRLQALGWEAARRGEFLAEMEAHYKAPYEPVGEETLAGGLSNTIAGRICNHFNLQGGGFSIDGACSSSLLAIAQACQALQTGQMDMALAGGVDLSLDPFELIGFAKTGALAEGEMLVYDQHSNGFLPGEGCGFLVLMRHEDALERGLRCYALIRGCGISSDGSGGITRPEVGGQLLALRRAYRQAGYGAEGVVLFEGHGTGTAVGDAVELTALKELLAGSKEPAYVGSVKANIGHTKAAAGAAGMLKAAWALHTQIIPPASGLRRPNPLLEDGPLRLLEAGRSWPADRPLRAGVSSFGFGGINVHIALESPLAHRRQRLSPHEQSLLASSQDAEVFLFGADDAAGLQAKIGQIAARAAGLSLAELADVSAWLASSAPVVSNWRAAAVAATPRELAEKLALLEGWLAAGQTRNLDMAAGVFLGQGQGKPCIAFLFPGQAAPVRLDGGAMERRFEPVQAVYRIAQLPESGDSLGTALAQPAIVAAELAGLRLLESLGIKADLALGHSLGELTALHWAGAMDGETLLRLVKQRGLAMADSPAGEGAMASIAAGEAAVRGLLEGEETVVTAGLNSPRQTVISGAAQAVARLIAKAESQGLRATHLPVSQAFHSPLMQAAAQTFGEILRQETFAPLQGRVVSTVTGADLAADEELKALLANQLTRPVRFTEAMEKVLAGVDLGLEVGPGAILSGLLRDGSNLPTVALDCGGGSLHGLMLAFGAAYALGSEIQADALFRQRFTRPFDPERTPRFFANPCESAPRGEAGQTPSFKAPAASPQDSAADLAPAEEQADVLAVIRELVARRAELPVSAVQDSHHLLRDLHLNSISVGQIVAEASRRLNLPPPLSPTEFANATLAQAAAVLEQSRALGFGGNPVTRETVPAGLDAWVLAFGVEKTARPLPAKPRRKSAGQGRWTLFAPAGHPWAERLREGLANTGGPGVLLCLPPETDPEHDALLLAAAHACLEEDGTPRRFVAVQQDGVAGSFVRSLYLEARGLDACVIDLPVDAEDAPERVIAEAEALDGFCEVAYDTDGLRFEPALRPVYLDASPASPPLSPQDVLLVSGGGKGIAAESALALARETGVRLLLLGRSNPSTDQELAANLERFATAGVAFRYLRADVTDAEAVQAAVAGAGEAFAPVTAILHGAGINQPRALAGLDLPAMAATQRPKIQGLRNLLAAVDEQKLRLLVAFGSVIGRIGLHGEADYALANARLSRLVEAFQAAHPRCHCLSLEWSIWSGVGMGERLGRVDALLQEGITPISPDQGMDWLHRLIAAPCPSASMVVSGRLGAAPPLHIAGGGELPFLRFLEHPRLHYPGVELVADVEISSTSDPYLEDHVYRGERLLPAVLGLEAMAQAAAALAPSAGPPGFESVEFSHPIVVDAGQSIVLRIVALQREKGRVEVALRCSQTAFQIDHFRGVCLPGQAAERLPVPDLEQPGRIGLKPEQDLYGKLLFHTGRFRRVTAYLELGAFHCLADIDTGRGEPWFARYLPPDLALGDPGSRDAAIHAIQACIPHGTLLPVGLDRLIPGDPHTPGPWTIQARERWQQGDDFCHDVEIRGADATLRERWEGLRLRRVAALPRSGWPDALLLAYWERRIRELTGNTGLAISLERGSEAARPDRAEQALHRLVGASAHLARRPDGKPEAEGERTVSVTHNQGLTVAMAGHAPLACDLEEVTVRKPQVWADLLGEERRLLAGIIAQQGGESFDVAATRVWASLECLIKAGLPPNVPLTLAQQEEDGWLLIGAGKAHIASFLLDFEQPPRVLAVLAGNE